MKKTVFALVAVSALGLVACGGNKSSTNASTNAGAATNEAIADVNAAHSNAAAATTSALDDNANAMANSAATGNASGNVTTTTTTTNSSSTTTNGAAAKSDHK